MKLLPVKKPLILFLTTLYFATNVLFATTVESNMWAERKRAIDLISLPPLSPISQSVSPKSKNLTSLPKTFQDVIDSLPQNRAVIQNVYLAANPSASVVLLQDVHLNNEAQTNIASILQLLIDQKQVSVVGVEGSFSEFNFAPYRSRKNQDVVHRVTTDFFNKNWLAAPSYVGIASANEPPAFIGVDDRIAYDENVAAYRLSQKSKTSVVAKLNSAAANLSERKKKIFSPKLLAFDNARVAYHKNDLGLGAYAKILAAQTSEKDFILEQFLVACEMESNLDLKRVDEERKQLLEKLAKVLTRDELTQLTTKTLSYRMGSLSYGRFYDYLKQLCDSKQLSLRHYPHFDNYVRYVLLSDGIQGEKLYAALDRLENQVVTSMVKSELEKTLVNDSEQVVLTQKLIEFSLTPREWEQYKVRKGDKSVRKVRYKSDINSRNKISDFSDLSDFPDSAWLRPFESFYEQADIRSQKMVQNLISDLSDPDRTSRTAALIVGGFHTPEITALLKNKNVSYVVVSPKISKIEDATGSSYLSAFAKEKTPLDKLFAGEKLFLALKDRAITDPLRDAQLTDTMDKADGVGSLMHTEKLVVRVMKSLALTFGPAPKSGHPASIFYRHYVEWHTRELSHMPHTLKQSLLAMLGHPFIGAPIWEIIFNTGIIVARYYFGDSTPFAPFAVLIISAIGFALAHPERNFSNISALTLSGLLFGAPFLSEYPFHVRVLTSWGLHVLHNMLLLSIESDWLQIAAILKKKANTKQRKDLLRRPEQLPISQLKKNRAFVTELENLLYIGGQDEHEAKLGLEKFKRLEEMLETIRHSLAQSSEIAVPRSEEIKLLAEALSKTEAEITQALVLLSHDHWLLKAANYIETKLTLREELIPVLTSGQSLFMDEVKRQFGLEWFPTEPGVRYYLRIIRHDRYGYTLGISPEGELVTPNQFLVATLDGEWLNQLPLEMRGDRGVTLMQLVSGFGPFRLADLQEGHRAQYGGAKHEKVIQADLGRLPVTGMSVKPVVHGISDGGTFFLDFEGPSLSQDLKTVYVLNEKGDMICVVKVQDRVHKSLREFIREPNELAQYSIVRKFPEFVRRAGDVENWYLGKGVLAKLAAREAEEKKEEGTEERKSSKYKNFDWNTGDITYEEIESILGHARTAKDFPELLDLRIPIPSLIKLYLETGKNDELFSRLLYEMERDVVKKMKLALRKEIRAHEIRQQPFNPESAEYQESAANLRRIIYNTNVYSVTKMLQEIRADVSEKAHLDLIIDKIADLCVEREWDLKVFFIKFGVVRKSWVEGGYKTSKVIEAISTMTRFEKVLTGKMFQPEPASKRAGAYDELILHALHSKANPEEDEIAAYVHKEGLSLDHIKKLCRSFDINPNELEQILKQITEVHAELAVYVMEEGHRVKKTYRMGFTQIIAMFVNLDRNPAHLHDLLAKVFAESLRKNEATPTMRFYIAEYLSEAIAEIEGREGDDFDWKDFKKRSEAIWDAYRDNPNLSPDEIEKLVEKEILWPSRSMGGLSFADKKRLASANTLMKGFGLEDVTEKAVARYKNDDVPAWQATQRARHILIAFDLFFEKFMERTGKQYSARIFPAKDIFWEFFLAFGKTGYDPYLLKGIASEAALELDPLQPRSAAGLIQRKGDALKHRSRPSTPIQPGLVSLRDALSAALPSSEEGSNLLTVMLSTIGLSAVFIFVHSSYFPAAVYKLSLLAPFMLPMTVALIIGISMVASESNEGFRARTEQTRKGKFSAAFPFSKNLIVVTIVTVLFAGGLVADGHILWALTFTTATMIAWQLRQLIRHRFVSTKLRLFGNFRGVIVAVLIALPAILGGTAISQTFGANDPNHSMSVPGTSNNGTVIHRAELQDSDRQKISTSKFARVVVKVTRPDQFRKLDVSMKNPDETSSLDAVFSRPSTNWQSSRVWQRPEARGFQGTVDNNVDNSLAWTVLPITNLQRGVGSLSIVTGTGLPDKKDKAFSSQVMVQFYNSAPTDTPAPNFRDEQSRSNSKLVLWISAGAMVILVAFMKMFSRSPRNNGNHVQSLFANFQGQGIRKVFWLLTTSALFGGLTLARSSAIAAQPIYIQVIPFGFLMLAIFLHEVGHVSAARTEQLLGAKGKIFLGMLVGTVPLKFSSTSNKQDEAVIERGVTFNLLIFLGSLLISTLFYLWGPFYISVLFFVHGIAHVVIGGWELFGLANKHRNSYSDIGRSRFAEAVAAPITTEDVSLPPTTYDIFHDLIGSLNGFAVAISATRQSIRQYHAGETQAQLTTLGQKMILLNDEIVSAKRGLSAAGLSDLENYRFLFDEIGRVTRLDEFLELRKRGATHLSDYIVQTDIPERIDVLLDALTKNQNYFDTPEARLSSDQFEIRVAEKIASTKQSVPVLQGSMVVAQEKPFLEGIVAGTNETITLTSKFSEEGQLVPRILYLEDQDYDALMMNRAMSKAGVELHRATDGRQALMLLETGKFDFVLTDIKMPGMSGTDFYRELKQRNPELAKRTLVYATCGEPDLREMRKANDGEDVPYVRRTKVENDVKSIIKGINVVMSAVELRKKSGPSVSDVVSVLAIVATLILKFLYPESSEPYLLLLGSMGKPNFSRKQPMAAEFEKIHDAITRARNQNQLKKAESLAREALAMSWSAVPEITLLHLLASILESQRRFTSAEAAYRLTIKTVAEHLRSINSEEKKFIHEVALESIGSLTEIFVKQGRMKDAVQMVTQGLPEDGTVPLIRHGYQNNTKASAAYAELIGELGFSVEAEEFLAEHGLAENHDIVAAYADGLKSRRNLIKALDVYEGLTWVQPKNAAIKIELADIKFRLGRRSEAFSSMIAVDSNFDVREEFRGNASAYETLASFYDQIRQPENALAVLIQNRKSWQSDERIIIKRDLAELPVIRYRVVRYLLKLKRPDLALGLLVDKEGALRAELEEDFLAYYWLAQCHGANRNWNVGLAILDNRIHDAPKELATLVARSKLLLDIHAIDLDDELLRAALSPLIIPHQENLRSDLSLMADAYVTVSQIYRRLKDKTRSIQTLTLPGTKGKQIRPIVKFKPITYITLGYAAKDDKKRLGEVLSQARHLFVEEPGTWDKFSNLTSMLGNLNQGLIFGATGKWWKDKGVLPAIEEFIFTWLPTLTGHLWVFLVARSIFILLHAVTRSQGPPTTGEFLASFTSFARFKKLFATRAEIRARFSDPKYLNSTLLVPFVISIFGLNVILWGDSFEWFDRLNPSWQDAFVMFGLVDLVHSLTNLMVRSNFLSRSLEDLQATLTRTEEILKTHTEELYQPQIVSLRLASAQQLRTLNIEIENILEMPRRTRRKGDVEKVIELARGFVLALKQMNAGVGPLSDSEVQLSLRQTAAVLEERIQELEVTAGMAVAESEGLDPKVRSWLDKLIAEAMSKSNAQADSLIAPLGYRAGPRYFDKKGEEDKFINAFRFNTEILGERALRLALQQAAFIDIIKTTQDYHQIIEWLKTQALAKSLTAAQLGWLVFRIIKELTGVADPHIQADTSAIFEFERNYSDLQNELGVNDIHEASSDGISDDVKRALKKSLDYVAVSSMLNTSDIPSSKLSDELLGLFAKYEKGEISNDESSEGAFGSWIDQLNPTSKRPVLLVVDDKEDFVTAQHSLLILLKLGFNVVVAGKDSPILNDATAVWLEKYLMGNKDFLPYLGKKLAVVSTGSSVAGTDLTDTSVEFNEAFLNSQAILSLGNTNAESLMSGQMLTRPILSVAAEKSSRKIIFKANFQPVVIKDPNSEDTFSYIPELGNVVSMKVNGKEILFNPGGPWLGEDGKPRQLGMPFMFPFVSRVRGNKFTNWLKEIVDLKDFKIPRKDGNGTMMHGVALALPWKVKRTAPGSVTLALEHDVLQGIPKEELNKLTGTDMNTEVTYQLKNGVLTVTTYVMNHGGNETYVAFGHHVNLNGRNENLHLKGPGHQRWNIDKDGIPDRKNVLLGVEGKYDLREGRMLSDEDDYETTFTDEITPERENPTYTLTDSVAGHRIQLIQEGKYYKSTTVWRPRKGVNRGVLGIQPITSPSDAHNLQAEKVAYTLVKIPSKLMVTTSFQIRVSPLKDNAKDQLELFANQIFSGSLSELTGTSGQIGVRSGGKDHDPLHDMSAIFNDKATRKQLIVLLKERLGPTAELKMDLTSQELLEVLTAIFLAKGRGKAVESNSSDVHIFAFKGSKDLQKSQELRIQVMASLLTAGVNAENTIAFDALAKTDVRKAVGMLRIVGYALKAPHEKDLSEILDREGRLLDTTNEFFNRATLVVAPEELLPKNRDKKFMQLDQLIPLGKLKLHDVVEFFRAILVAA